MPNDEAFDFEELVDILAPSEIVDLDAPAEQGEGL
jgi:hypothetical protein